VVIFTVYSEGTLEPPKFLCCWEDELFRFRMLSSCALHTVKPSGESILRIRGCFSSTSQRLLIPRMPSPSLYLTLNIVTTTHHSKRSRYQCGAGSWLWSLEDMWDDIGCNPKNVLYTRTQISGYFVCGMAPGWGHFWIKGVR
jgi:hypothetical protein